MNTATTQTSFPTWKTIKVGKPNFAEALKAAILKQGFEMSAVTVPIFGKIKVSPAEQELDLVVLSANELGIGKRPVGVGRHTVTATYADICAKGKSLGLELCPQDAAAQLRLQYTDQPDKESIMVVMEPVIDSLGNPIVFSVCSHTAHRHPGYVPWLRKSNGNTGWDALTRFAFVKPRQA